MTRAEAIDAMWWALEVLERAEQQPSQTLVNARAALAVLESSERQSAEREDAEEFKPCVAYFEESRVTEMVLEDTAIVWSAWRGTAHMGHAVDVGYSFDGRIVGMRIWDDVREPRDAGPAAPPSPDFAERARELAEEIHGGSFEYIEGGVSLGPWKFVPNATKAEAESAIAAALAEAEERGRRRGREDALAIAEKHRARVENHDPDKPRDDELAQGYGNAALNIACELRALIPASAPPPTPPDPAPGQMRFETDCS